MKSLSKQIDKDELLKRLGALRPDSSRRWGRMTAHQMVCHLNDSFKSVTGEREVGMSKTHPALRPLMRWFALRVPLPWPHGLPTMPGNDQERGGTPPEDFQRDVDELATIIERLTSPQRDFQWRRHPLFDEMAERDWMRWGYLHVDHHLRQFGI
jgi:Protein of unknown function (DUF1569)